LICSDACVRLQLAHAVILTQGSNKLQGSFPAANLALAEPPGLGVVSQRVLCLLVPQKAEKLSKEPKVCRNSLSRFSTAFSIYEGLPPQIGPPSQRSFFGNEKRRCSKTTKKVVQQTVQQKNDDS
jgi:hypothetical protein